MKKKVLVRIMLCDRRGTVGWGEARGSAFLLCKGAHERCHTRVLEGVAKSRSPLKVVVFKSQQPCPDKVALHLNPLLHSGVGCTCQTRLAPWYSTAPAPAPRVL